jgi:hypothetical protein
MIYVASITHDIKSNTFEVLWLEKTDEQLNRVKCRNYSPEQKSEFLNDLEMFGDHFDGTPYITLANW